MAGLLLLFIIAIGLFFLEYKKVAIALIVLNMLLSIILFYMDLPLKL